MPQEQGNTLGSSLLQNDCLGSQDSDWKQVFWMFHGEYRVFVKFYVLVA